MKSILDPSFRYTRSSQTDLRQTFARVRLELQQAQARDQPKPGTETRSPPTTPRKGYAAM